MKDFELKPISIKTKDIRIIILYAVPISLWPTLGKKTGIFILGTLTLMTVGFDSLIV